MSTLDTSYNIKKLTPATSHIWLLKLEPAQPEVLLNYQTILSSDELKRANQFKRRQLQERFIITRATLRQLLGHYLEQPAKDIVFSYSNKGKPSIFNHSLAFNLSHSGNYVAYAFTLHQAIGIDIEKIDLTIDLAIAKRFFHPQEFKALVELPSNQQAQAFFHLWTQKEAILKASGLGIVAGLHKIQVSCTQPAQLISNEIDDITWKLQSFEPASNYAACIATQEVTENFYYHVL